MNPVVALDTVQFDVFELHWPATPAELLNVRNTAPVPGSLKVYVYRGPSATGTIAALGLVGLVMLRVELIVSADAMPAVARPPTAKSAIKSLEGDVFIKLISPNL